jgi:hypothetical protein
VTDIDKYKNPSAANGKISRIQNKETSGGIIVIFQSESKIPDTPQLTLT